MNLLLSILHSLLLLLLCSEELLLQLQFERRGHDAAAATRDENENENEREQNSRHPNESLLHGDNDDECHSDSTITEAKTSWGSMERRGCSGDSTAEWRGGDDEGQTRSRNPLKDNSPQRCASALTWL